MAAPGPQSAAPPIAAPVTVVVRIAPASRPFEVVTGDARQFRLDRNLLAIRQGQRVQRDLQMGNSLHAPGLLGINHVPAQGLSPRRETTKSVGHQRSRKGGGKGIAGFWLLSEDRN
jgi:hypothetical protein